jgi:recombinational DNA repair protein RecR
MNFLSPSILKTMSAIKETIQVCPQCNRKNITEDEVLCDSCKDIAFRGFDDWNFICELQRQIQKRGKVFIQHLLNKYD